MKKNKIFKFKKNGVNDLTHTPEFGCNIIECGNDRFTLTDFKLQEGHDDSLPYTAILRINGKPICKCINTGWGEQTAINPLDIQCGAIMASVSNKLSKYEWQYHGTIFSLGLYFIADTLAITESHEVLKK